MNNVGQLLRRGHLERGVLAWGTLARGSLQRYTATGSSVGIGAEASEGLDADGILFDGATTPTITPTASVNAQFSAEGSHGLAAEGSLYDGATTPTITPTAVGSNEKVEAE